MVTIERESMNSRNNSVQLEGKTQCQKTSNLNPTSASTHDNPLVTNNWSKLTVAAGSSHVGTAATMMDLFPTRFWSPLIQVDPQHLGRGVCNPLV